MKLANVALLSVTLLGLLAVGCKQDDSAGEGSTGSEAQLLQDDTDSSSTDDDMESNVDEPLSGGAETDPGTPATGASDDEVLEKVRVNAGHFFKPAGCLTSTRSGNKIAHVFNDCSGPWGFKHFSGTINATYTREPGKLTVNLEFSGTKQNGADITGTRVIVYTIDGTTITKERTGNWTGTSKGGKPMTHTANFKTTYDDSTKCITRDGSAQTTVGGREHERTIDGFKRCGIGSGGCPVSGEVKLTRTKSNDSTSLTIDFEGGHNYSVTLPNGTKVEHSDLICNANAG